MNDEILNPNCSEIVWRLNVPENTKKAILRSLEGKDISFETDTSVRPNGCLEEMFELLEDVDVEDVEECSIEFIENCGGGGDGDYIEECLEIAKKYKKGEITKKEADKLDEDY